MCCCVPEAKHRSASRACVHTCARLTVIAALQIQSLAECLVDNKSVTELDLSGNRAGAAGCKALGALLSLRTCGIRTVSASTHSHTHAHTHSAGPYRHTRKQPQVHGQDPLPPGRCMQLASCAMPSCPCTQLVLNHMHLADKDVVPIATALENNGVLRTLDMSHNDVGDRAAVALGNCLGVSMRWHLSS